MCETPSESSATLSAHLSSLQSRALSLLCQEREYLESEIADLTKRKQLALRRLHAHKQQTQISESSAEQVWLSLPQEIIQMRRRLQDSHTDENSLLEIVKDVREKRIQLLERAVDFYANKKDDWQGE